MNATKSQKMQFTIDYSVPVALATFAVHDEI